MLPLICPCTAPVLPVSHVAWQRLGDLMWELHNIWVLPLQILVALVILFKVQY